jgi:transposase
MGEDNTSKMAAGELTIGLDLGDRFTEGRVIDSGGELVEGFRVRTTPRALSDRLASYPPSRIVLEVGTHSPWISRLVAEHGHEAIVANPRRVRLISENDSKSDGVDAELLARLGRIDPACSSSKGFGLETDFAKRRFLVFNLGRSFG